MRKRKNSLKAKLMTSVLIICMLTGYVNTDFALAARAEEGAVSETAEPSDAGSEADAGNCAAEEEQEPEGEAEDGGSDEGAGQNEDADAEGANGENASQDSGQGSEGTGGPAEPAGTDHAGTDASAEGTTESATQPSSEETATAESHPSKETEMDTAETEATETAVTETEETATEETTETETTEPEETESGDVSGNDISGNDISGNDVPEETEESEEVVLTIEVNGITVRLEGLKEAFPDIEDFEGFALKITEPDEERCKEAGSAIEDILEEEEIRQLFLYDITLTNDEKKVQPKSSLQIVLEGLAPDCSEEERIGGYYIGADGAEEIPASYDEESGDVTLTAEHFSEYAVAVLGKAEKEEVKLTAKADGLTFTLTGGADAFPETEEKLQLKVEKLDGENRDAAAEKIDSVLEDGWKTETLAGYSLKLMAGEEETGLAEGKTAKLTVDGLKEGGNGKEQEEAGSAEEKSEETAETESAEESKETAESESGEETAESLSENVDEDGKKENTGTVSTKRKLWTVKKVGLYDLNEENLTQLAEGEGSQLHAEISGTGNFGLAWLAERSEEKIELKTTVNGVEIILTAPIDTFPEDGKLTLHAEEIIDERLEKAIESVQKEYLQEEKFITAYRLFDVSPLLDGGEIQPQKPVTVAFRNLMLEKKDGDQVDALSKLKQEFVEPHIQPRRLMRSASVQITDTETDSSEIRLYHFCGEENVEQIRPEAKEDLVIASLDHFSLMLMAETEVLGPTTEDKFDEKNYTLPYILGNFNVFASGDYHGTHVVGPMIVGGGTELKGSLGGLTQKDGGEYEHKVSSYLKGIAENVDNKGTIPRIIVGNPNLKVYFGLKNRAQKPNLSDEDVQRRFFYTDEYVGFGDGLTQKLIDAAEPYMKYEGYDASGHKVKKISITKGEIYGAVDGTATSGGTEKEGCKIYKDSEGVKVQLDVGYNFTFETFEGIHSIYYRYEDASELQDTMTIVQTMQNGIVGFPRVFKTVKDDIFGNDYKFDSIEKGPQFTVLYFAPNAETVLVGCEQGKTTSYVKDGFEWITDKRITVSPNSSKLVGHLWVPQADVVLAGGDYNGCVVAQNVDAVCSGSEGHMWPFIEKEFEGQLELTLKKTIDGELPGDNVFSFTEKCWKVDTFPQAGGDIPENAKEKNVQNTSNGKISFINQFEEAGNYVFRIYEGDLSQEHVTNGIQKDDTQYEVHVEIVQGTEKLQIKSVTWYKGVKEEGDTYDWRKMENGGDPSYGQRVFDNKAGTKLVVTKNWEGYGLNVATLPEVKVHIYQTSERPTGHKVTFEVWSSKFPGWSQAESVFTEDGGFVEDQGEFSFITGCTDVPSGFSGFTATNTACQINGEDITEQAKNDAENLVTYKVTNVTSDIVVKLLYYENAYGYTGGTPTRDMFIMETGSGDWAHPDFRDEDLMKKDDGSPLEIVLNAENGWRGTFLNLPKQDASGNPYYYKIVEDPEIPGFIASYENQSNNGEGEAFITNTKKDTPLQLVKIDADDTSINLPGAEFCLKQIMPSGLKEDVKFIYDQEQGSYIYNTGGTTETLLTGDGGSWKISGLPEGTYELIETKAPDGYNLDGTVRTIVISADNATLQYGDGALQTLTPTADGMYLLYVTNQTGIELPKTGGSGTLPFTVGGLLLIAGTILLNERKRKGRKEAVGGVN